MYELYDTESGNRLAGFRTVDGARRYLLAIVRRQGRQALDGLVLGQYDAKSQRTKRVASGKRLASWAVSTLPRRPAKSAQRAAARPKQLA